MTTPLIDIYDRTCLNPQINTVVNDYTGRTYPMQQNIPVLLHEYYAGGLNQYRRLYHWLGNSYDATGRLVGKLLHGNGFAAVRKAAMAGMDLKNGDRVLLVSVGAGIDFSCFPEHVDVGTLQITGTDVSLHLLQQFQKQLDKRGADAQLINCCAEALPFEDGYFDAVFVNGMQFFTDRQQAIRELIRVTGKGGQVVIADEADRKERKKAIPAAAYLVPGAMEQLTVESYRNSRFYSIGFKKP